MTPEVTELLAEALKAIGGWFAAGIVALGGLMRAAKPILSAWDSVIARKLGDQEMEQKTTSRKMIEDNTRTNGQILDLLAKQDVREEKIAEALASVAMSVSEVAHSVRLVLKEVEESRHEISSSQARIESRLNGSAHG